MRLFDEGEIPDPVRLLSSQAFQHRRFAPHLRRGRD
jgi:hypothetical protein